MFSIMISALQYQVFSIAEFEFCYNYVFYRPFQEKTSIILSAPFTFDDSMFRDLCTRTDNVLYREVNQTAFSIHIESEFNLAKQPFSLFFFVWTNVTIYDTQITMKLSNTSNSDFAFLVATVPEYSIKILSSSFSFTSKDTISNFYGIANNLSELLTINRSSFVYSCMTSILKFYGISSQLNNLVVQNSSFSTITNATSSYGFVQLVLGSSSFKNLTVSGTLSGANTFGFIYENKGSCSISNITFSLVTKGSMNCGFVQISSGSVSTSSITFVGFANIALISEPSSYSGATCPCISGSILQNGLCYCATGSLPVSNSCQCTVLKSFIQYQVCICPVGASNIGGTCTCTSGATMVGNTCVCTTNAILTNGICVCQPGNSQLIDGQCNCTPMYSTMQGSTCVCAPQYMSMQGSTCTCPTGASIINGNCVCTAGATMTNGVCVCTSGATLTNGVCVCCPGASLSGGVCVCNKKAGSTLSGGNCICTKAFNTRWGNGGNYYCSSLGMCCSTRAAGPSYQCSNNEVYWSPGDCGKSNKVT
ncbi:Conserved_hypothetical protein [Hexamita inflata]|uniref:Uncharacterized protein n=1 Tax=Hexamita inflata TaxID=28002 RepID=A0AA86R971_9EUKA|nr:Conserved hypothetical protein [Hexamita inflata]